MDKKTNSIRWLAGLALYLGLNGPALATPGKTVDQLLGQIETLENKRDPKCYATASRLEDFMFGTPLSDKARFRKNQMQKQWMESVWDKASELAKSQGLQSVDTAQIQQVLKNIIRYKQNDKGHWQLDFGKGRHLQINKDDKRQFSTVAYSLRALLAVQQEALLAPADSPAAQRLPLTDDAIKTLKDAQDFYILGTLKIADQQARNQNRYEIDEASLVNVWQTLASPSQTAEKADQAQQIAIPKSPIEPKLLKALVDQKVRSYAKYNNINNQLFVRNLQVFFARNRWPADSQEATDFRQLFTETVIAFAGDFYHGAQKIALSKGHPFIEEEDVAAFSQQFIPHRINEYEDAIFFPRLPKDQQVTIEAYDMDAFRDSGIHWRYLQYAVLDPKFKVYLEPDPFAAELIVENIAQFGVLALRMTGDIGHAQGDKRIALDHFKQAMATLQKRINANAKAKDQPQPDDMLASADSSSEDKVGKDTFFSDVTAQSHVDFMHRSSDWLNRLLRSYLKIDEHNGTITIPPAFGGSGVAVSDINNDGRPDILLIGGLGNHLYLNLGDGQFKDISKTAGIDWVRPQDNLPGEVRQPLIADLDNDGLQDIVITYVNDEHRVYKNLGDGKFEDMTTTSKLGGVGLVGGPATVFDYDNDGLLDIYIEYFGDYLHGVLPTLARRNANGLPNKLFHNLGNFRFEDVTAGSNLDNRGWGQAVTHTDLDGDGKQDLIVGNDFGVNAYYHNLGDGKFEEISATLGTDKPSYTMGIGLADLNQDLQPDIYISNIVTMNKDEKYVLPDAEMTMKFNPNKLAKMRVIEANDLFLSGRSQGKPSYHVSKAVGRGYSSTGWSWDADFFDYDNDGDDDLYVLNGINEYNLYSNDNPYYTDPLENKRKNVYVPVSTKESNVFFVNQKGRLNNVSKQSGVDLLGNSRSAAYFDMDGDGDLDIVLNNYHEKAVLYRNNSEKFGRNWLKIKLTGDPGHQVNLDAIGSRIVVTTADKRQRWREVSGTIGYMSVHPKVQHFGLDKQDKVDVLVIWPNGHKTRLKNVKANQTLEIKYQPKT